MNWSDLLVIGIIAGFGLIGLSNGFILSIFRIASFFVSVLVSVKFYPVVADFLMKTTLYSNIRQSIFKNLMKQQTQAPKTSGTSGAEAVINGLNLPDFMKDMLKQPVQDTSKLVDLTGIVDYISGRLATFAVEMISLVLLFILISVAFTFARFILQGIAKLPLFKQFDKLGGFALGAVEGLLTIYILFAVIMLFNAAPQLSGFFEAMDSSQIAKYFYQNNFIVDWMFPKSTMI